MAREGDIVAFRFDGDRGISGDTVLEDGAILESSECDRSVMKTLYVEAGVAKSFALNVGDSYPSRATEDFYPFGKAAQILVHCIADRASKTFVSIMAHYERS